MYLTRLQVKRPALVMLAVATAASVCLAACSSSAGSSSAGTLRVGVDPTYAPFEFYQGKTMVGFNIDLAKALAKQLKMRVEFVQTGAGGEDPALKAGKIDMLATHTVTPERAEVDAFTNPFLAQNFTTMVTADSELHDLTVADLAHMKLGVLAGSSALDFTQKELAKADVAQYDTAQDAIRDLKLGRVQAIVEGSLNSGYTVQQLFPGQLKLGGGLLAPKQDARLVANAVQKSNKALLEKLNVAIAALQTNGELDKIVNKWFGDIDYAP
jgi:polar amino acid transport system substrate-binding protein